MVNLESKEWVSSSLIQSSETSQSNGAAERSYPVKEPIDYRLWIVELIYVFSIVKEMVLNEYVDQKVFRTG